MAVKRKRESSTSDSPKPISTSTESRPTLDLNSGSINTDDTKSKHGGSEGGGQKGPKIKYIAAEGSTSWSKSLDLERDYAKSLKHIGKKLGVSEGNKEKLRLSHVRDGGREVEIYDDFDYQAFKARAIATPSAQLILKVYGGSSAGGSGAEENAEGKGEKKAQKGKGKGKEKEDKAASAGKKDSTKESGPSNPTPSPTQSSGQSSSSKAKSKPKQPKPPKPSNVPPQVGSTSSPTPSSSPSSPATSSSKKAEQNRKRKAESEMPSTPSPAPSASSLPGARPTAALHFHNKYKPARPSPLNPNRVAPTPHPVPSPATPGAIYVQKLEGKIRRDKNRKKKEKKLAKKLKSEADGKSDASTSNTSQATPQKVAENVKSGSNETSKTTTPQSVSQKKNIPPGPPLNGSKAGSVDQSPPRKRARRLAKKAKLNDPSPVATPAPPTPMNTTTPQFATAVSKEDSTVSSSSSSATRLTTSTDSPSTKMVVRVSNENYDLKQKPNESKAVSSSINGEKRRRRKSKARSTSSVPSESSTPGPSPSSVIDKAPADSADVPKVIPATSAEPSIPDVSDAAPAAEPVSSIPATQPVTSSTVEPSTPATKKGKSKATPKPKPASTLTANPDETPSSPAPISSSQENQQASSSPPPSSDPSNPGTPSKKKKTTKSKKAESSEPSMMQQILARQRERVAAEKAAKAALEAGTSSTEVPVDPTSSTAGGVTSFAEAKSSNPPAVGEAEPEALVKEITPTPVIPTETEPVVPTAITEEPTVPEAIIEPVPTPESSSSAEPPAVPEAPIIEAPTPVSPVPTSKEAVPSSEDLFPSSIKSTTNSEPVPTSSAEVTGDVLMREPTPDVEPAVEAATPPASPKEHQPAVESATTVPELDVEENVVTPAHEPEIEAEVAKPADLSPPTTSNVLVPETIIPPKATSTTSGSSKGKSTKTKRKVEVPCIICLRTPWHIQKDCPEVKAGPSNLRYLLTARQEQHASISEDDESHFESSIEAISEWIERLEMITGKVNGVKKDKFKARSPVKIMGNKEGLRLDLNADESKKGKRKSTVVVELGMVNGNTDQAATTGPVQDTTSAGATNPTSVLASTSNPISSSSDSAQPTQQVQSPPGSRPESPMAVPDTYNFPPIHLRAMQKSRRPGSLSGLSVSDAIIETESSDDSSSEDEEDGVDSDTSSVVSDTSTSDSDSDSASDSDSDGSDSGSSRVVMPSDPSDAMKFSLTRDLSEREKKKARLSAAKMQPVTCDFESVIDDEGTDNDNLDISPPTPTRPPRARAGSDSSIGDFGDGDSRRSSIDSTATAPYRSQAPPVIASSTNPARSPSIASEAESIEDAPEPTPPAGMLQDIEEINEAPPSTIVPAEESDVESEAEVPPVEISSGQRSRSFRELEGMAASSPDLDDSAGLEAVRQGMADEGDDVSMTANGDNETINGESEAASSNPVPTQSLSQVHKTRSGASATEENVIIPASQPLRRSSRTSISAAPPTQESIPRRLRSVSRDIAEKTPPPTSRSTRSRSTSQVPMSPSTPKARRASRTMIPDVEEETPKQTSRRTRVTRSTQPEEFSLPTVEQPSQSQSANDRQTQSTPVRRSTRASPSPLFMTQGSQIPATQFYNPNPETFATEPSSQPSSQANGRKTRGRKAASPIPEEQEQEQEEDGDVDIDMSPKSASESLPPIQSETEEHPTSGQADPADDDIEMDNASRASSSDDENENENDIGDEDDLNSIPDIQPPKPRILPPTSSQSTTPIYPSLSSLPKELLRKSWNILSGNNPSTPVSARQALTNGHRANTNSNGNGHSQLNGEDSDDSGSSSDSSVEAAQAPPSVLKGRFASGGMKKKPRNSQVAGW